MPKTQNTRGKRKYRHHQKEWEGYFIVKAILLKFIFPERIVMRDGESYCGILLDNNRKPLYRLHFNRESGKHISTFDVERNETNHKIESMNDIYQYAEDLKTAVKSYLWEYSA
ncbi:MAG: hypothetical protein PUB01_03025 [Desulfovibrionaceae bacterium]|nr:hypothetical protein [Desulfovibrionaceae bacterium]